METPAVLGSLRVPASTAPSVQSLGSALAGQAIEATLEALLPGGMVLRLPDGRQFQAQGTLPFPAGSVLTLKALPLPAGAGLRLQVTGATPPPTPAVLSPLVHGEALALLARLQSAEASPLAALLRALVQRGAAAPDQPDTWSTWMKESMKALADPATSPAESVFHRLQAKEGTGLFELPLPWAPGAEPLRIWVEEDGSGADPGGDTVRRVFLSLAFSALGEVRMGIEQRSSGLRVRLWLQEPDRLAGIEEDLRKELAALGRPFDLRILPLPLPAPDLRALAGAPPLRALG